MSWDYEKVAADLRAEGFRPLLLVSGRPRPDLGEDAGELRFQFPTTEDEAERARLLNLVKKALFEEYLRERLLIALPWVGERREELAERALELARLRRRHRDN